MAPEIGPHSYGIFEKQAPGVSIFAGDKGIVGRSKRQNEVQGERALETTAPSPSSCCDSVLAGHDE